MNSKTIKKRNYSIEFLRFFFMVLIVFQHYLVHGLEYRDSFVNINQTSSFPLHMALMGLSMIGVSGFMFISGYYGITFKFERIKSLWFQAGFYVLILGIGLFLLTGHLNGKTAFFLTPFEGGGWWYLVNYIIVFLIAPILNKGISHVERKEFRTLLILYFGLLYIDKFLSGNYGTELPLLLFVYLLGRYIRLYKNEWTNRQLSLWFIIGLTMLLAIPYTLALLGKSGLLRLFFSNYNPFVLITSVTLVLLLTRKTVSNIHPIIAALLSNTLAIYLITDYRPVRYWIVDNFIKGHDYSLWAVIGVILIISILCLVIEEIRKLLFKIIEKIRFRWIENFITGANQIDRR